MAPVGHNSDLGYTPIVEVAALGGSYRLLRKVTKLAYGDTPLYRLSARAANVLRRRIAKLPKKTFLLDDFFGDLYFYVDTTDHIGSLVLWAGMYADNEIAVLEKHLNGDSVFFDVGANIGVFSVVAASIAKNGQVFSFEPVGFLNQRLQDNIQVNRFENVRVEKCALGEEAGELDIFLPTERATDGTHNVSMATLFDDGTGKWGTAEKVPMATLDDYCKEHAVTRIDVMKMDIEGAELFALRGATDVFEEMRPKLLIELNEVAARRAGYAVRDLETFLTERNYRLHTIGKKGRLVPYQAKSVQTIFAVPAEQL